MRMRFVGGGVSTLRTRGGRQQRGRNCQWPEGPSIIFLTPVSQPIAFIAGIGQPSSRAVPLFEAAANGMGLRARLPRGVYWTRFPEQIPLSLARRREAL